MDYTKLKNLLAGLGGITVGLLGGWDVALQVLVVFVVIDYITGVIAAAIEGKLDSRVGFVGIAKKILLFVPIVIAAKLDLVLNTNVLRSIAIFFYLANEGLSVLENLGRVGVPLPEALKRALEQLRKKGEEQV